MRMLRSKKGLVLAGAFVAAAALTGTAVSALISETILRDSTNVHMRVSRFVADGFDSGWHTHPGLVVVQVQAGSLQITQGSCTAKAVNAGDTFIEVPFSPVRAVGTGHVEWTTTLLVPYEDRLLTPTTSPCP